jgi:hypothetical protein
MWSVPLGGWLADRKGRKVALLCAYTVLMCSTVAAAFATTPTFYLIARHFNGVGIGSQSMSAYVLGTEVRCLLLCIRVSTLRKREPPEVSGVEKRLAIEPRVNLQSFTKTDSGQILIDGHLT